LDCVGRLIFARFFIFLSVNIILKKSLLYLSFGILLEKETIPNQNQKDSFYWGLLAAENKTYGWKCVGKGLG